MADPGMTDTGRKSALSSLRALYPALEISTDPQVLESHGQDWTRFRSPAPCAVAFPRQVGDVVQLVEGARRLGLPLVPSGGRTGLSGGAVAARGELVVAMDRMRRILEFDPAGRLLRVEAGVVTAEVQRHARGLGLDYPVSFASEGSAQIGGNIATNAGGIRVLRHGLTRDRVAGLVVVDGRGAVLDLNRGLVKNASGYDLRHLFIGSEGTLGIVVEATLQLTGPAPPSRVMLLGVTSMPVILDILQSLRGRVRLSACEFFSRSALDLVCTARSLARPLDADSPYYLLVEFDAPESEAMVVEEAASDLFADFLERGWTADGVISQSETQAAELWAYRESISESAAPRTPYKNDLSVRLADMPAFLARLEERVMALMPGLDVLWYGHVGDGNLHLNLLRPEGEEVEGFEARCKQASREIYEITAGFGGSVSAEHGIGLLKRDFLSYSRSAEEIEAMRGIKGVFDPDGILNPGKLL